MTYRIPSSDSSTPQPGPAGSLKNQQFELEPKLNSIKTPLSIEKPSESDLIDAWKHKETLWKYVSNYNLIVLGISSVAGLVGFGLKSKALRRFFVKRFLVQVKNMNLSTTTQLNFISRPKIFQEWDIIVNSEASPQQMMLIEGYQGTGKSFLVQKYVEEQSLVRPTLYITLRNVNLEEWRKSIGNQINFYPERFLRAKGMN